MRVTSVVSPWQAVKRANPNDSDKNANLALCFNLLLLFCMRI
jgi:hypothetical protein